MNCFGVDFINITTGNSSKGPEKDYSLKGDTENRLFGIFNAVGIIATTYGNGIIPEIQVSCSSIPIFGYLLEGETIGIERNIKAYILLFCFVTTKEMLVSSHITKLKGKNIKVLDDVGWNDVPFHFMYAISINSNNEMVHPLPSIQKQA